MLLSGEVVALRPKRGPVADLPLSSRMERLCHPSVGAASGSGRRKMSVAHLLGFDETSFKKVS